MFVVVVLFFIYLFNSLVSLFTFSVCLFSCAISLLFVVVVVVVAQCLLRVLSTFIGVLSVNVRFFNFIFMCKNTLFGHNTMLNIVVSSVCSFHRHWYHVCYCRTDTF